MQKINMPYSRSSMTADIEEKNLIGIFESSLPAPAADPAAEAVLREGGVIIICAACNDGHGGDAFYKTLSEADSPAELLKKIEAVPRNKTLPDQWQYQILARILNKFHVIIVTQDCPHQMIRNMKMLTASNIDEALKTAYGIVGNTAKTAVIPDGVSVIADKKGVL